MLEHVKASFRKYLMKNTEKLKEGKKKKNPLSVVTNYYTY